MEEHNRQLAKPAKRETRGITHRDKSRDQIGSVKSNLVVEVQSLHKDAQRIDLSSVLLKWKAGNCLLALKSLVGHGNFEREFDSLFGETLSFRQAQRYMHVARTIALAMQTLRERLRQLRPDLPHDDLSDDVVLQELEQAELMHLLHQRRNAPAALLVHPAVLVLTPEFGKCLQLLGTQFECAFMSEATELPPGLALASQKVTERFPEITEWPNTVIALADASKQVVELMTRIIAAFAERKLTEALCVVPAQVLNQLPELLLHPEVLLNPSEIYLTPKKGKITRYLVIYLAPPERHRSFLKAFSPLGIVKLPVQSNQTKG